MGERGALTASLFLVYPYDTTDKVLTFFEPNTEISQNHPHFALQQLQRVIRSSLHFFSEGKLRLRVIKRLRHGRTAKEC